MSLRRTIRRNLTNRPRVVPFDFETYPLGKRLRVAGLRSEGLSSEDIARHTNLRVEQVQALVDGYRAADPYRGFDDKVFFDETHHYVPPTPSPETRAMFGRLVHDALSRTVRWVHSCGAYTRRNKDGSVEIVKTPAMGPTGLPVVMPEGFEP